MTIQRRLAVSNILIILLPVLLAIVICLVCMNAIWTWTTSGGGSGFADSQEFYDVCQSISREVEEALRAADDERDFARQLQAVCRDLQDDSMRLVIRSDGEKLFQTFYRGDAARRNPEQGSGLGLAIAAAMVHGMHGSIRAQNVQPHGLAILIRLPERGASA